MKFRLYAVASALCCIACALSLSGCAQKNSVQTANPSISETVIIELETTPAVSEPVEEPSEDVGAVVTADEPQNLLCMEVGVHPLDIKTEYRFDLDGDGIPDTLELRNNEPEWSCDVLFNGKKINGGDEWTWISQAHLIRRTDNSTALIYQQDGDDNCRSTSIYTFNKGNAKKAEYRGNAYSFLTPGTLLLTGPVYYFLGNQHVSIEGAINENFTLTLGNDGWFTVASEPDLGIPEKEYRAKVDIQMMRLDNGAYVDATLPTGTRIYPQVIDEAQTRMIMKTDDGALWMYTRDSTGLHFEEGDLFEGCTYAGP